MKNNWKAEIIKMGEIDSSGNMEVVFSIKRDGKVLYDNQSTTGDPETCLANIKQMGQDIKEKVESIEIDKIIQVGMEVEL